MSSTAEEETAAQRKEQHPIGLLAGVVMVTAIMMAALLTSVYIYNHPTSSISLFFIEVSQRSLALSSFIKGCSESDIYLTNRKIPTK